MTDKRWENPEGPVAPEVGFDNFRMVVSAAEWVINPDYMQGQYVLLELAGVSPDLQAEYARQSIQIPVGKTTELKIDPADADHLLRIDGSPITQFPPRGLFSTLIKRAMSEWGLTEHLKSTGKWFDNASIWLGLNFQITREIFEYTGKSGFKTERRFPTKFLGMGETVSMPASNGPSPDALNAQLQGLWESATGHEMFVQFATALPAVRDNAEILAAVTNPIEAEKRWGSTEEAKA